MIGQTGASSSARQSALAKARDDRERDDGARFSLDEADTAETQRRGPAPSLESAEAQRPRRREDEELRAAPASGTQPQETRPNAEAARDRQLGRASAQGQVGSGDAQPVARNASAGESVDGPALAQGDQAIDGTAFAIDVAEGGADASTDVQAEAEMALPEGFDAAPEEGQASAAEAEAGEVGAAISAADASTDLEGADPTRGELDEDQEDLDALNDLAQDGHDSEPTLSGKDRLELSAHRMEALRPAPRAAEATPLADRLAEATHRTLAETHDTSNVLRFRAESHTFSALVQDGAREVRFTAESAATRAFIAERIAEVRGELHKVGQPASVSLATDTDGQRQQDARRDRDAEAQGIEPHELGPARSPRARVSAAPVAAASIDAPDHLNIVL